MSTTRSLWRDRSNATRRVGLVMRAVTYERYGPPEEVLELRDVPVPVPTDDQVLIRVRAVSVNASDWETLRGKPLYARVGGLRRPKNHVLGSDVAGVVEAVGSDVTEFSPGDEVVADLMYFGAGGFAEYVTASKKAPIVRKPASLGFEDAAALPQGGVIALQAMELIGALAGKRVLINGAGGAAGVPALQLAKARGAEVVAVDNAHKVELLRALGADRVIDYAAEDPTRAGPVDLVLDLAAHRSIFAWRRALARDGRYAQVGGSMWRLVQAITVGPISSLVSSKKMGLLVARFSAERLQAVLDLVAAGTIQPVIQRVYMLEEVPQALRHHGDGMALGKVVVSVG